MLRTISDVVFDHNWRFYPVDHIQSLGRFVIRGNHKKRHENVDLIFTATSYVCVPNTMIGCIIEPPTVEERAMLSSLGVTNNGTMYALRGETNVTKARTTGLIIAGDMVVELNDFPPSVFRFATGREYLWGQRGEYVASHPDTRWDDMEMEIDRLQLVDESASAQLKLQWKHLFPE